MKSKGSSIGLIDPVLHGEVLPPKPKRRRQPAPPDPDKEIVAQLKAIAKKGVYGIEGTQGLAFKKDNGTPGVGSFTVRYELGGRRPTMGLGSLDKISLADARKAAEEAAQLAHQGIDPIAERDRKRQANLAAKRVGFKQMTENYLKPRKWRHKDATSTWINPVKKFAYPVLANLTLEEITIAKVVAVIERIEAVKDGEKKRKFAREETARRVVSRIATVLDAAIALSGKAIRNPADRKLIEKVHPLRRRGDSPHFRRIELDDAPAAFQALREAREPGNRGVALDAWLLMISTAARPSEALQARWEEIDFDKRLWTVPAVRTKTLRKHVAPLSSFALELLERRLAVRTGDLVFAGRGGSRVGYANFSRAAKESGVDAGSPHSWRSIFRDWATEIGNIPPHLAELALAHALTKVQAAYARGAVIEPRRPVMEAFASWLAGDAGADVIALPKRA